MAKKPKSLGKNSSRNYKQVSIYDQALKQQVDLEGAHKGGTYNIDTKLKQALNDAISGYEPKYPDAGLTKRDCLAGEMSKLLGISITESKINTWTRGPDENGVIRQIPAAYLGVFCKVCGDHYPIAMIAKQLGLFVLESPDAVRSEIAKINEEIKDLQSEKRRRITYLSRVDGR